MSDNQHTVALADLSVKKVRDENPQVADALSEREERIDSLQDDKAGLKADVESLEDEVEELEAEVEELEAGNDAQVEEVRDEYEEQIAELEDELEAKNDIIEGIRESEREDMLAELRQARATINGVEPEEVDLTDFEEASTDEIRPALEIAQEAAEAVGDARAGSSATSTRETVGGSTSADTDEARKMQIAEEMGVKDLFEKAEDMSPEGFEVPADAGGD